MQRSLLFYRSKPFHECQVSGWHMPNHSKSWQSQRRRPHPLQRSLHSNGCVETCPSTLHALFLRMSLSHPAYQIPRCVQLDFDLSVNFSILIVKSVFPFNRIVLFSRRDSDVVAPYEKWEYFDPRVRQVEQDRNYAQNKTKKVMFDFWLLDSHKLISVVYWRSRGLFQTAQHATIDCSSLMSFQSTLKLTFMVHVGTWNAREQMLTSALTYWTATISSTWPLRIPTVVITSLKSSSLTGSREQLCR